MEGQLKQFCYLLRNKYNRCMKSNSSISQPQHKKQSRVSPIEAELNNIQQDIQASQVYNTPPFSEKQFLILNEEMETYNSIQPQHKCKISAVRRVSAGIQIYWLKKANYTALNYLLQQKIQADYLQIFSRVVDGVLALHENGVVHKNLRLTNIFSNEKNFIKIGPPLFDGIQKQMRIDDSSRFNIIRNIYYSPQAQRNQGFSFGADVWALGVILLQMLLKFIIDDCTVVQLREMAETVQMTYLKQLIKMMLRTKSRQRPTIGEIKNALQNRQIPKKVFNTDVLIKIWSISLFKQSTVCEQTLGFSSKGKFIKNNKLLFNLHPYIVTIQLQSQECISLLFENIQFQESHIILINNESIPYPLNQFFYQVTQIYAQFSNNRQNFALNECGEVEFYLPNERYNQLRFKNNRQNQEKSTNKKQLFQQCIGNVQSFGQTFRGFLIGLNLVLTSAEALYDRLTNTRSKGVYFSLLGNFQSMSSQFCYPIQFQTCTDQKKSEFNYGLIILKAKVNRTNALTLLYNYDQSIVAKKIEQLGKDMSIEYFIGTDRSCVAEFLQFKLFRQKKGLQVFLSKGDPILVKFSNERVGVIGMVTGQSQTIIFTQEFHVNIFKWLLDMQYFQRGNVEKNLVQLSLRLFDTKSFNFVSQQIPFINAQVQNELKRINQTYKELRKDSKKCMKVAVLLQSQGIHSLSMGKNIRQQQIIRNLNICKELYGYLLGGDNWKTSLISFLMASIIKREIPGNSIIKKEISGNIEIFYYKVIQLQQKYLWNPLILCKSYFEMAKIENGRGSIKYYQKIVRLAQEYNDHRSLGDAYHGLGNMWFGMKNQTKGIQNYMEGIKIKHKHCTNNELMKILIGFTKKCFKVQQWNQGTKSLQFQQILIAKGKVKQIGKQAYKFIKQYWVKFIERPTQQKTISQDVFSKMVKIIKHFYPQNSQLLAKLYQKVRK